MSRSERNTMRICGVHAVRALAEHRIEDIQRVHIRKDRISQFSDLLKWCANRRKPYHVADDGQLQRLTKSVHHEGVTVLARTKREFSLSRWLTEQGTAAGPQSVVVLVRVRNPHNLGALLRTAAHFGADAALVTGTPDAASLSTAACRMAEGGAEVVDFVREDEPRQAIRRLHDAGFTITATASGAHRSLFDVALPERTALVFGPEAEGLGPELLEACDRIVTVPGTGAVDSLNVSCSVAVVLGELWRQREASRTGSTS